MQSVVISEDELSNIQPELFSSTNFARSDQFGQIEIIDNPPAIKEYVLLGRQIVAPAGINDTKPIWNFLILLLQWFPLYVLLISRGKSLIWFLKYKDLEPDIAKLNSFSRYVGNKDQLNDNAGDIIEQTKMKLENLRA